MVHVIAPAWKVGAFSQANPSQTICLSQCRVANLVVTIPSIAAGWVLRNTATHCILQCVLILTLTRPNKDKSIHDTSPMQLFWAGPSLIVAICSQPQYAEVFWNKGHRGLSLSQEVRLSNVTLSASKFRELCEKVRHEYSSIQDCHAYVGEMSNAL